MRSGVVFLIEPSKVQAMTLPFDQAGPAVGGRAGPVAGRAL